jgi:hypothetical protein
MNEQLETVKSVADATNEVAKTTGKAIDTLESFAKFISHFIQGSLEQGMGIVEDKLKYVRWERQIRFMSKVDEVMKEKNIYELSRPVPMTLAIPIFSNATIEENNYLQDKWVEMLINAACVEKINVERAYISILEELSEIDVLNLEKIYEFEIKEVNNQAIDIVELPNRTSLVVDSNNQVNVIEDKIEVSLQNIARLGLIRGEFTIGGFQRYDPVYQTKLGKSFMAACTLK